jgi:hypothetical protein
VEFASGGRGDFSYTAGRGPASSGFGRFVNICDLYFAGCGLKKPFTQELQDLLWKNGLDLRPSPPKLNPQRFGHGLAAM